MPDSKDADIKFLAERCAMLMAELVSRDFEFGDFCHDEWYQLERVKNNRHMPVCMDFVRNQLRRHRNERGQRSSDGENGG